jgi:two-component sensor histidine kinase
VNAPDYTFDEQRLATLKGFGILDTPAEAGFDGIAQLAAQICDTPVSLVSFVADDRQWFKARVGFEPCETDLSRSVCAHVLVESDLLVIEDLSTDPRTRDNPLVTGEPGIRFYAGAPLRAADGATLGSLCVIDGRPRPEGLTARQAEGLRNLAQQVMSQLELRRALAERDALLADNRRAALRRNSLLSVGDQLRALNNVPEVTQAAAKIVCETLGLVRAGFGRLDKSGKFVDVDARLAGRHRLAEFGDLLGRIENAESVVVEDVSADPRTHSSRESLIGMGTRAIANLAVRDQRGAIALFFAHSDHPRTWAAEDLTFLHNVGDRIAASVARADAEAVQRVLNLELSHRMKNTFALVQAIAKQTLRAVPDQVPVQAFASRLLALSTAHDALLKQNWTAAEIGDVVKGAVGNIERIDRFTLNGPEVTIGPRSTLSLSLLLHELSTNALKYGALSRPDGHVHVRWAIADGNLVFTWREVKGPTISAPARKGFGTRLINLGLIGTGGVAVRYPPTGFEADFEASLSQLREA